MAGYILYSLDGSAVEKLLEQPSRKQLEAFAEVVSNQLDYVDVDLKESDAMASWPSEPSELVDVVASHLATSDWYGAFSEIEKDAWESSVIEFFETSEFGMKCESDGVYWNVIDEARRHYKIPPNAITDLELTQFGTRPLRFRIDGSSEKTDSWRPNHSMHLPAEIVEMSKQFAVTEPTIRKCSLQEVEQDYEELMSVLDRVLSGDRVLYVSVDT